MQPPPHPCKSAIELHNCTDGTIDQGRREGRRNGRFLLLGSAALDLLAQSGETLARRISFVELGPLRTYLERDIPQFGPRIPAETLRRMWTMLAHNQGDLLNAAQLARGLGVSGATVAHYLDLMVDLLLVRRLPPRLSNVGKRLVRSPEVYVRDSGLVHALLGLADKEAVLGHPVHAAAAGQGRGDGEAALEGLAFTLQARDARHPPP